MANPAPQTVSQPQFIIQSADGQTYYLTVSLWSFQPGPGGGAKQAAANAMKAKFDQNNNAAQKRVAVELPVADAQMYTAMIT